MVKTIIDESVHNLAKGYLSKMKNIGTTANKLKALISSYKHGIKKTAEIFDVHPSSIHRWAKELKENNLDGLINKAKHNDGLKLRKKHKELISSWLGKDPNLTIDNVHSLLRERCNLRVSRSTVHRAMQSVGFSYITPRPKHYKQDTKKIEEFKKKSTSKN